ncbi:MAG: dihydrolipoyllysine-residue succinyltransferase [Desulfuromonas sp.]|nr:MAG: dihydrolipoyllysine-residue succinyltransferase [Desulfuromonas sp.]
MKVIVPEVGESIFEATIAKWHVGNGSQVAKDDLLCELETDKISLEIHAEAAGVLTQQAKEGETVKIGDKIAEIDGDEVEEAKTEDPAGKKEGKPAETSKTKSLPKDKKTVASKPTEKETPVRSKAQTEEAPKPIPDAKIDLPEAPDDDRIRRVPMTSLRRKVAAHLLAARQQTAMLTTFNEADMTALQELRKSEQMNFQKKFDIKLGLMSLFVKATVSALQDYPEVNARIDGNDIVYQDFYDIGIAIGAEKGLVVPVLRSVDQLSCAEIEKNIKAFADKIAENKLTLDDLKGGTFSISNGGVYGSVLSTPILNPPQTAILGMHAIKDRPVAIDGKVVIRPIMNLALSYDHRLVDGRQAVGFLRHIKEFIEAVDKSALDLKG